MNTQLKNINNRTLLTFQKFHYPNISIGINAINTLTSLSSEAKDQYDNLHREYIGQKKLKFSYIVQITEPKLIIEQSCLYQYLFNNINMKTRIMDINMFSRFIRSFKKSMYLQFINGKSKNQQEHCNRRNIIQPQHCADLNHLVSKLLALSLK